MSTCRICNEPVSAGESTCPKHVRTDPAKRAMIGLPEEMQHTPPSNARAPTPATAVLRIPLPEGGFADAPTPVVNPQLAPLFVTPDAAPFGPAQPPPVVDENHPDAVATSVFRVPAMPSEPVDDPAVTAPSNQRLQIPIFAAAIPEGAPLEAPTVMAVQPVKPPVTDAPWAGAPLTRPAPVERSIDDQDRRWTFFIAGVLIVSLPATAGLLLMRGAIDDARATAGSLQPQPEKQQAAIETVLSFARGGALPSEIDALAGGLPGAADEPRLILARGLSQLHAGNWAAAIELLSKVEGDKEATDALNRARQASLTDER